MQYSFSCLYFTGRHVTSSLTLSLIHSRSEREWCGSTGISSAWCKALWQLSCVHTENKWNVGACFSKINKRQAHIKGWVVGCVEVALLETCHKMSVLNFNLHQEREHNERSILRNSKIFNTFMAHNTFISIVYIVVIFMSSIFLWKLQG